MSHALTPWRIEPTHGAADAFWQHWKENGETHKHGYYESTWGAINAALAVAGVRLNNIPPEAVRALVDGRVVDMLRQVSCWGAQSDGEQGLLEDIRALLTELGVEPAPVPWTKQLDEPAKEEEGR